MSQPYGTVDEFMNDLSGRYPHEQEFLQAVREVVTSVMPVYLDRKDYQDARILHRITEPDRVLSFRVTWERDDGTIEVNKAWRVQFSNALGPYKGGLRFHPTVNESVLKFLGFEQIFKNSLTGLPMGGAKGGSNFDPKGKSDREIMRFCQSLMNRLYRHIGEDVDVPAGDIGVGGREISYLFGHYLKLANRWSGVLTGKGTGYGGSLVRTEATGYGCVYFCENMMEHHEMEMAGKTVTISGSGNVAIYAAEKSLDKMAKVLTLSDSGGFIHFEDGITREQLAEIKVLKEEQGGRLKNYADGKGGMTFHEKARPWGVPCDIAMPCATQNELDGDDARALIKNGVKAVSEGANMPTTAEAMHLFEEGKVLHAPGKASNAGGVAVSGLEQSQNALRLSWEREEVDQRLQKIMKAIHSRCVEHSPTNGPVNYVHGSNIAGFVKVADTLVQYGVI